MRTRSAVLPLLPAAALALFSFAAGTFTGAASVYGAATVHLVLLAALVAAAGSWPDPLSLGRRGALLAAAFLVLVALSCWASPVSRAGWTVVALLPAWLTVPAFVAAAWGGPRRRRIGSWAVAVVVAALAAAGLYGRFVVGDARAAWPLGHHNPTAVWLLALLPLALLPWRDGGAGRWLAGVAGGLGLACLVATGSLSGALGLAAVALLTVAALLWRRRGGARARRVALVVALAAAAALVEVLPRVLAIATGADASFAARRAYWLAALTGVGERPGLGWGPGSTAWTLGTWVEPRPGVHPAGEVIGDLHSTPLAILYELGGTGLVLAVALLGLFVWRRLVALPRAADRGWVTAGLLGLGGAATAGLAIAPLALPAVVAALALAAGAALAGERRDEDAAPPSRRWAWLPVAWAFAAVLLLARVDLAHLHHDRALWDRALAPPSGDGDLAPSVELAAAVDLDPDFPLYRARLARLSAARSPVGAAGQALAAAEAAPGVAALWLSAGELGAAAGEPWAAIAFEEACRLDPLGAAAPFRLATLDPGSPTAAASAARSFLAEPRLAAALFFEGREALITDAVAEVERWDGVDTGWRESFVLAVRGWRLDVAGDVAELRFTADRDDRHALSLDAFRRRPLPADLVAVPVRRQLAVQVELPPAASLALTEADAFAPDRGCQTVSGGGR